MLAVTVALAAAPAQAAAAEAAATEEASTPVAVGEVVVTARRREETLRSVPVSAIVQSGDAIAKRNIVRQEDLSNYTPNFRMTNGAVGIFRFVRGLGSSSNAGFDQAVGAFTDQAYTGRGELSRIPFYDIDRVEVLRGPQVIAFGNSTTAGALSITTRKPGHEFSADALVSYEFNNRELITQSGVTLPINDKISVRLAGFSQQLDDGWVHTVTPQGTHGDPRFDNKAFRVSARIEPVEDLRIDLKYETADLKSLGGLLEPIANVLNNPIIGETKFDKNRTAGSATPFGVGNTGGVPDGEFITMTPQLWSGTAEYNLNGWTFTSTTAGIHYDFVRYLDSDATSAPLSLSVAYEQYNQISQELRFNGKFGTFVDVSGGAYFEHDNIRNRGYFDTNLSLIGNPLPAFSRATISRTQTDVFSVFADATFHLSDRARIAVGARFIETSKDVDHAIHGATVGTHLLSTVPEVLQSNGRSYLQSVFGAGPHDYTGIKIDEHHLMPQAIVQYDITPDVMAYAKVVQGSKAGGYDAGYAGSVPTGGIFKPEKATSYEAGVKGLYFDRRLNLTATIFHTDFQNLQQQIFNGVTFVVGNAAESKSQGLELESVFAATPELTLNGSLAYLDSTYSSFKTAGCSYPQRAATPAGVTCVQDLSGRNTLYASKYSGNVGAEYKLAVGEYTVTPRVDVLFRSGYMASSSFDPIAYQKGYYLVDARLDIAPTDGNWTIGIFGKNLTDKYYLEFASDISFVSGARSGFGNRGQQFGVQLGAKF
ncbi:TonB-dependent receptor [Phenylobacterium sp.]|uniref:TonB-dependent receptor n=1 Tax=Phenylobacterium sp. TaxID=1871053 RepID=UPI0035AFB9B6